MNTHLLFSRSQSFLAIGLALSPVSDLPAIDLGSAKPFTLLQLGNQGSGDGELSVDSESIVNGNVGKANDGQGKDLKVSSSVINGSTFRATGVDFDVSSSTITGSNNANVSFVSIVSDALNASATAAALPGISDTVNLNGTTKTFIGTGGANVINVDGNFILNSGAVLSLVGGPDDYFVFNIAMVSQFLINDSSILLTGLDASRVLFNILGSVPDSGPDDVTIQQSLVFGTILAPGRHVIINDNEAQDGNGLVGAVIAGGKLLFAESTITHNPFMLPMRTTGVPESGTTLALLGVALGLIGIARRKFEA